MPTHRTAQNANYVAEFRLQFPIGEIGALAARLDFEDDGAVVGAGAAAGGRGYYTRPEFVLVCAWKTPRSKPLVASNAEASVEDVTRAAFANQDEAGRMAALCSLRGVSRPTASVLLHFAFPDGYPIIDWRALESLGQPRRSSYPVPYWLGYLESCRNLAADAGVTMRTLDRALWQYSREREDEEKAALA
jgi:hypothetical protein